MEILEGVKKLDSRDHYWKLKKAFYRLKQAGK